MSALALREFGGYPIGLKTNTALIQEPGYLPVPAIRDALINGRRSRNFQARHTRYRKIKLPVGLEEIAFLAELSTQISSDNHRVFAIFNVGAGQAVWPICLLLGLTPHLHTENSSCRTGWIGPVFLAPQNTHACMNVFVDGGIEVNSQVILLVARCRVFVVSVLILIAQRSNVAEAFGAARYLHIVPHLWRPCFQRCLIPVGVGVIPGVGTVGIFLDTGRRERSVPNSTVGARINTSRFVSLRCGSPLTNGQSIHIQVVQHTRVLSGIG